MIKKDITCDIENREHKGTVRTYKVDVVFTTEQNQGDPTSPYIDSLKMELCESCRKEMLVERVIPEAQGAMGYNHFSF